MKRANLLMTMLTLTGTLMLCPACAKNDGKTAIGILQYATHAALDKVRDGFVSKLAELGYGEEEVNFIVKNPQSDPASMQQMATYLESQNCDLVFGIGTPAAISLKNSYDANGNVTPLLFSAVTDAVSAGLVASNEHPGGTATGTSDMNPVADQIDLLLEVDSAIKTIGILYTASENNSKIQADLAVLQAQKRGIETKIRTVDVSSSLATNVAALLSVVDALYLPTDNVIAANMDTVIAQITAANKAVPICVGEEGMVKSGGVVTLALDYTMLGQQTGQMAADILAKKKIPSEIAVETQKTFKLIVNQQVAATLGVVVPQTIIDRADVVILAGE